MHAHGDDRPKSAKMHARNTHAILAYQFIIHAASATTYLRALNTSARRYHHCIIIITV